MSGSKHTAALPALPQKRAHRSMADGNKDVYSPYSDSSDDFDYPQKDYTESHRHQTLECAKVALGYYNNKNHTNYELVEAMDSCAFNCAPTWIHCNFMARDGDSSTKLFFAELYDGPCHRVVTACRILKGKYCSCDFCENDAIKHPNHGFRMRQRYWLYQPYALRSRSRPRRLI